MSKKRKICPVCGTDYPEDYAFCGQCVDEEGNSIRLIKETDTELPKSQVTLSSSSPKKVKDSEKKEENKKTDNEGKKHKPLKIILILLIIIGLIVLGVIYGPTIVDTITTPKIYTVTFDTGGLYDIPSQSVERGKTIYAPSLPERPSHDFVGWYLSPDSTKPWDIGCDKVTRDITLYAKWEKYYIVTFDTGGYGSITPRKVGEGVIISAPDAPVRKWYIFDGWYSSTSYRADDLWDFTTDAVNSNIVLYAKWTIRDDDTVRQIDYSSSSSNLQSTLNIESSYEFVRFVGKADTTYNDYNIVIAPRTSDLTIEFENFNYKASFNKNGLDASQMTNGVFTLSCIGLCSISGGDASYGSGKPGIFGINVILDGEGSLKVNGGNGAVGSDGGNGIIINQLTNKLSNVIVTGGNGGNGADGTNGSDYNGGRGSDGSNGGNGGTGLSASSVSCIERMTVYGGNGGNGGKGGNGGDGMYGQDGKNAWKGNSALFGAGYKFGENGGNGLPGGDGGNGGNGGEAGKPLDVPSVSGPITSKPGKQGNGGNGGNGGDGGDGGDGGKCDGVVVSTYGHCTHGGNGGNGGDGGDGGNGGTGAINGNGGSAGKGGEGGYKEPCPHCDYNLNGSNGTNGNPGVSGY